MLPAYIPSPPGSDIGIGPLRLHVYGALIVAGVVAAVWLADRRWRARGGVAGTFSAVAMWGVPGGLIGARLYHVATDYELYTHHPLDAFKIWQGGLGIWGGIAGGVLGGWIYIRRHDLDFAALLDCAAPALPLAQAIGRWGNYFNQELFGRPTTLPWGLKVDAAHQPLAYPHAVAFHPTFLYESLWDLATVALLLLIEKRLGPRLRKGYLFWVYVALYTFGRFFTEYLRIDFAHKIAGLRLNDWTSIVIFVVAVVIVLRKGIVRAQPAAEGAGVDDPDLERNRVPVAAGQAGSTLSTTDLHEEIRPPTDDDDGPPSPESPEPDPEPEPEPALPEDPTLAAPAEPEAAPEPALPADPTLAALAAPEAAPEPEAPEAEPEHPPEAEPEHPPA